MSFLKKLFGGNGNGDDTAPKEENPPEDFPFSLEAVAGEKAISRWEELQATGRDEGFTPVILGSMEDLQALWENGESLTETTEEVIEKAKSIDVSQWLSERAATEPDEYTAEDGEWPEEPPEESDFTVIFEDTSQQQYKKIIYIAKIPTREAWQIPAYLRIGDWNECPAVEFHVAMAKHWQGKYQAVIVTATYEILEYKVANPPTDQVTARQLAQEQFVYCTDIVHQGAETLNNLAASLQNGKWYFWWD